MAGGFDNNAYGQNYATGGGGGGFMNNSQSSPSGANKANSSHSLRAVTVRQVINATQQHSEAEILVDGAEVGHVTFVGIVRNLSRNATNVSYNIEDGTGMIDVRAWSDNSSTALMAEDEFKTDHYVRIIGVIKSFQGRRTINAGHIRLVTDFNEVFYHKLDVIHTHLQTTRGAGVKQDSQMATTANPSEALAQFEKPLQREIMKIVCILRGDDDSRGVHVSAIARKIPGQSEKQVREEIDHLTGEGYLYSAESEEHVLPTITV